MGPVPVAAGILRRGRRILICRRLPGGPFGLRWELPGGKVEAHEAPADALVRELREELGIDADAGDEVERVEHAYPGQRPVRLHFFEVARFSGEPENRGFDQIRWTRPGECLDLDWLEADRPLLRRLAASPDGPLPPLAGAR